MSIEQKISEAVVSAVKELYDFDFAVDKIAIQKTRKEFVGDMTVVVFPFVKAAKAKPEDVGAAIGEYVVQQVEEVDEHNTVKGFLNLGLSDAFWKKQASLQSDEKFGFVSENSGLTYMVEYSSPNTNKPLHLGHLRNNFLGYSVAEILKANGHKVIKTQIINDRGIHICKSMVAWLKFAPQDEKGVRATPESTGVKGDKFVGNYYVAFDKAYKEEIQKLVDSGMSEEQAKKDAPIMKEAQDMLVKWEARDPQTYLLWERMNGWVYQGFDVTYEKMGVDFDKLYYESDTYLLGKDVVVEGLKKGVFFKKEDGSVWIDLTDEGLDEKLLLRADGTAVYMTQDIGTAIDRKTDYPDLNGVVYTVGNEQDYHFKVLFKILDKLGYDWAKSCYHLSYGMVDLPTGKMKSREGTVVDADDLMESMVEDAKASTQERGHIEGMSEEDKSALYNMIGLGALKYYILKVDPKKRMMFNPEESVDLNGNTGPFIQYTHARIQSLLAKAKITPKVHVAVEMVPEEKELIKHLYQFPAVIKEAGEQHSPALIANYTYDLVKLFNGYYQSVTILKEENETIRAFRLQLAKNIAQTVQNGMKLLGVNVPDRM